MSSEFKVEVVKIGAITKHPNADSLSMTVVNGQTCIMKTGGLNEGDLAVYVPEDSVVPLDNPVFAFLKRHDEDTVARVRPVRLRKIYSEGILIPCRELGFNERSRFEVGQDLAADLKIVKYEQPVNTNSKIAMAAAKQAKDPGCAPRYDMEPFLKLADYTFVEGEEVVCTEKIHGCNARFVVKDGTLFVGSHNTFRSAPRVPSKLLGYLNGLKSAFFTGSKNLTFKERFQRGFDAKASQPKLDPWWKIAKELDMEAMLKDSPGVVVYGEVYGQVQDLTYSVSEQDVVKFAAFDVYDSTRRVWLCYDEARAFCGSRGIPFVPELFRGKYSRDVVMPFRAGKSAVDGVTLREGFVIRRVDDAERGRASLKLVSEEYKLRKEGTEFH